jgi:glutaredoxin
MGTRRRSGIGLLFAGMLSFVALMATTSGDADTIYKSVGPDGKVIYSDRPAAGGRLQKTLEYRDLPASPLPESVRRYREELEAGVDERLSGQASDGSTARLFTATWCGYCRKARRHLAGRGIAFRELDIESPDGMRAYTSVGGSGVPVLIWKDQRIDGYSPDAYDAFADSVGKR